MEQKPTFKKWEISVMEIQEGGKTRFKVTRRLSELRIGEAKFFATKEEAKKQADKWLS